VYHFDCTKVMFSSGNGTEKARIVRNVMEENIAEIFSEEGEGETVVDLYAGIGYFTLPLLVHTVVPTNEKKDAAAASASSSSVSVAAPSTSKLRFLHACELNPNSLTALHNGLVLNKIAPSRYAVHAGDNRRAELTAELNCTADRISLGLLPSAEDGYRPALRMLKERGGVLHVHANIPEHSYESFQRTLEGTLREIIHTEPALASSVKSRWTIQAFRLTLVKNYAPRVGHVVVDVACFSPESTWWKWNQRRLDALTASTKSKPTSDSSSLPTSGAPISFRSTHASSDPSHWYPFSSTSVPIIDGSTLTYEEFRRIVEDQKPVVLRGVDLGTEWRSTFTPASLLALSSKSSPGSNPLVTVHVSPHSSRMDFLQRNYMFKQMRLREMIERMLRIGGEDAPNVTAANSAAPRSAEAPALSSASSSSSSSSAAAPSITRDSYFISPHELYYLRSLGSNPKTEIADFRASFPVLAKKIHWPKEPGTGGRSLIDEEKLFSSVFRVASKGLQLWTHYDIADNVLLHLHGLKRVVLFPPTSAVGLGLKPDPDSSSSPILDIDRVNAEDAAWSASQATGRQVILLPGDALFIPALWMHNVTSLDTKFAEGYAKFIDPSAASKTSAANDLRACGDICISLNLFWRELPLGLYQAKDLYGNKDLVAGVHVLQAAADIARELENIPKQYAEFYARRAVEVIRRS
jgi:hypothetical protein